MHVSNYYYYIYFFHKLSTIITDIFFDVILVLASFASLFIMEHESSSEKEKGSQQDGEVSGYNQVDHLVSEIGKFIL